MRRRSALFSPRIARARARTAREIVAFLSFLFRLTWAIETGKSARMPSLPIALQCMAKNMVSAEGENKKAQAFKGLGFVDGGEDATFSELF